MSATVDLSGTNAITVAFWMFWTQFTDNNSLAMEFGPEPFGFNSSLTGFVIDPNSSQGGGTFEVGLKGDGGYNQVPFARPSAAAWHHCAFVFEKGGAGR